MGLLDRVSGAVKGAANRVSDAADSAVAKAKETVQQTTQKVEQAVTDVVDHSKTPQSPDAAARPTSNAPLEAKAAAVAEPVKKALTADATSAHMQASLGGVAATRTEGIGGSIGGLAGGLGVFAQKIKQTGQEIRETASQIKGEVQKEADEIGRKAVALGQKIEKAPQAVAEKAAELGGKVEELGRKAVELGGIGKPLEAPPGAVDKLKEKGQELINTGKQIASYVDQKTNPEKQVDNLKPGDKFTFSSSGGGSINIPGTKSGVITAGQKVTYEVEAKVQTDPKTNQPIIDPKTGTPQVKYMVSFDAESGAGGGVSHSGKGGSGGATGQVGVGGKVEYAFNSPEDAKKGIAALNKQLQHAAISDISRANKNPLTADEQALLNKNVSSVELRGNAAVQLGGELGMDTGVRGAGKLTFKGEPSIKLNYTDGQPTSVSVKGQVSAEGQGAANAAAGDHGTNAKITVGQVTGKATVSVERSFPIPPGTNVDSLLNSSENREKTIKAMRDGQTVTVSGQFEGSAHAMGNGYAVKSDMSISGPPDKVLNPDLIAAMAKGDHKGAAALGGDKVQVTGSASTYELKGLVLAPEINIDGVGQLGFEVGAVTAHQRSATYYGGTGTQAAQDADRAWTEAERQFQQIQQEAREQGMRAA